MANTTSGENAELDSAPSSAPRELSTRMPSLFGRHTAIYGLGTVLGMLGSFLLIPFVTRSLGPADYGVLELFNRSAEILLLVVLVGMRQSFIRHFFERDGAEWKAAVSGTALSYAVIMSAGLMFLVFLALPFAESAFPWSASPRLLMFVLALTVGVQLVFQIGTAFLQVRMEAAQFVLAQASMMILYVGFALVALYWLEMGLVGVVVAHLVASAIVASACAIYLVVKSGFGFDRDVFREMFRFGLPFVPASLFSFVLMNADRYLLALKISVEEVGVYALAAKVAGVAITLVGTSVGPIWGPFIFSAARETGGGMRIGEGMFQFVVVLSLAAIGASALAPFLIPLLAPPEFHRAVQLVPLMCLVLGLYSLANLADAGVLIAKQTWLKPFIFAVGAAVTIPALLLLIPHMGAAGAGIGSGIGVLALLLVNLVVANRYFRIHLPTNMLALWLACAGTALLLICYGQYSSQTLTASAMWGTSAVGIAAVGGVLLLRRTNGLRASVIAAGPDER